MPGDIQFIFIRKRVILLRIKHFQQHRRRIAPESDSNFVDFIEHEYRIGGTGTLFDGVFLRSKYGQSIYLDNVTFSEYCDQ